MDALVTEQIGWIDPDVAKSLPLHAPLTFEIHGVPAPQGSLRTHSRNGKSWASSDNPRTRPWRAAVTAEAARAVKAAGLANPAFGASPIAISIVFRLPRPKGHYGKRGLLPSAPTWPAIMPDLDKLARAALDALTGIVWRDDAQVIALDVYKRYQGELEELRTTIEVAVAS